MTHVPAALADHLEGEVTTLCHCWRLKRADGTVFGFTDHDGRITVDGTRFEPHSGLSSTEARQALGLAPGTVDVAGALSSDLIRGEEIDAGLFDSAEIETFLVNWRKPAAFMSIRKAIVGKISRSDGRFTAELETPVQSLDQPNGRIFRKTCDAELGDARCRVDVSRPRFAGLGSIIAPNAASNFEVRGLGAFSDGWFSNGELTWVSGSNKGIVTRVIVHEVLASSAQLTLDLHNCAAPAKGDQFSIQAGCDKRFSTCKAKFANGLNFRGFPHMPGNDAAYAYVRQGYTFDGGPLVP